MVMARAAEKLTLQAIQESFEGGEGCPRICSPQQLADEVGVACSTLYQWIAQGRLKGVIRKRGKHNFIWRDGAIELLFNGPDWSKKTNEED